MKRNTKKTSLTVDNKQASNELLFNADEFFKRGLVCVEKSLDSEAISYFEKALPIFYMLFKTDKIEINRMLCCLDNLIACHGKINNYTIALDYVDTYALLISAPISTSAVAIKFRAGLVYFTAENIYERGLNQFNQRNYLLASEYLEQAQKKFLKKYNTQAQQIDCLTLLAKCYYQLESQRPQATINITQALDMAIKFYGADHPTTLIIQAKKEVILEDITDVVTEPLLEGVAIKVISSAFLMSLTAFSRTTEVQKEFKFYRERLSGQVFYDFGVQHYEQKKYDLAIEFIEIAKEKFLQIQNLDKEVVCFFFLAACYDKLGFKEESREAKELARKKRFYLKKEKAYKADLQLSVQAASSIGLPATQARSEQTLGAVFGFGLSLE